MKKTSISIGCIVATLTLGLPPALARDVVVIANKSNANTVDRSFITSVYLGKTGEWPDGTPVAAFDQAEENPVRERFYATTVGKSPAVVKMIWAQMIFSGKRLPPRIADPDAEMKRAVTANKNAHSIINRPRKPAWLKGFAMIDMGHYRRFYRHPTRA